MIGPREVIITDDRDLYSSILVFKFWEPTIFGENWSQPLVTGVKTDLIQKRAIREKRLQHGTQLKAKYNKETWRFIAKEPGRGQ